ncbi:hypothetical protein [Alcanivorax sp. DP30]|uniref:hypothetical protein n=1 Tax=Alcanivorax sp. DP30 TaxID=2606217 RepID=UPI001370447E|nr:hypothetical protein [Alcanivorax sp. DP30]MZR63907.1 hypothetical protein [Alcanivorax sp. DP30]
MSVETVYDVMELTRKVHHKLAEDLDNCYTVEGRERVRMLLAYLSEHESKLEAVIKQAEQDAVKAILNTWLSDYLDGFAALQHLSAPLECDRGDADAVLAAVLVMHERLIELYRYLADKAPTPSVAELLGSLMELEHSEAMRMARDAGRLNDI